jgi:crotonobetainyl-CoA:carnitine CoA-transferase CaiB-like acyl-CoA transferase
VDTRDDALPLAGVRVVELATWAFVPSATAVLAEWGADVVKIEHPSSPDPLRGLSTAGRSPDQSGVAFMWELHNRGKSSITLDVGTPGGVEVLHRLFDRSDVFATNLLPSALRRRELDAETLLARHPRLVYAVGSGMGTEGAERDRPGFDFTAFWARSSVGYKVTPVGAAEPAGLPAAAFGDVISGLALAGGIVAALLRRSLTGSGGTVETSLLASGMWAMRNEIAACDLFGVDEYFASSSSARGNPLTASYRSADGRFVQFSMLQPDRHWPELCRAMGLDDLTDDPRFATTAARSQHAAECIALIQDAFGEHDLAHWESTLAEMDGAWATYQTPRAAASDAQATENHYVRRLIAGTGNPYVSVAPPVSIDGVDRDLAPAPEFGASTEMVLLELGYDWDDVGRLRDAGVIA